MNSKYDRLILFVVFMVMLAISSIHGRLIRKLNSEVEHQRQLLILILSTNNPKGLPE